MRIPVENDGIDEYLKRASERLQIPQQDLKFVKILNKSLDTACKEQFYFEISIVAAVSDLFDNKSNFPVYMAEAEKTKQVIKDTKERPLIAGFGPAGMFAALELISYGFAPIIFERGKKIEDRSNDVQRFIKDRILDTESNIQFGEGGAGSYSDGKLFSRTNNTNHINRVLDTFIKFGAPQEIGYKRKPHLGTDVLCRIVRNIRNYILERGGEIYYSSKVTDILIGNESVSGVLVNGNKEYRSSTLFLAVGNSARDTFEMLHRKGIALEQKSLLTGLRIEHPAEIINEMRYGAKYKDFSGIGAAVYSLNYTDRKAGRGVYTFCMCPGGEVINASSEEGRMVVNGMSYSGRDSEFSNAALVVTVHARDYESTDALAGIKFQKNIEEKAFFAGGGGWKVPAQNLEDFLSGRISGKLNNNSFKMGTQSADMSGIFPDFISAFLIKALESWRKDYPLFISDQAVLLGPETRTSSPVKIKRTERYESINIKNLYPIGEGSGYTGGITSAAADAIKAVEASLCM